MDTDADPLPRRHRLDTASSSSPATPPDRAHPTHEGCGTRPTPVRQPLASVAAAWRWRYLGMLFARYPFHGLPARILRSVAAWALWQQSRTVVSYVLSMDLLVLGGVIVATGMATPPTAGQGGYALLLLIAATIHLSIAWTQEESRRAGTAGPHIDLTSVWTYGAVVVLPAPLAVALAASIRIGLYPIAHRPVFRYTFSSAGVLAACLVSGVVLDHAGHTMLALLIGGRAYWSVSALTVAGAIALTTPGVTWREAFGVNSANLLEAASLVAAAGLMRATLPPTTTATANAGFWTAALTVMVIVAVLVAAINRSLNQYRQDHHEAALDPKTGLLNTRGWHRDAVATLHRAWHDELPSALLMLDLDHFKRVNDTWGHPAGDAVLAAVAATIQTQVRPGDVVARFGGEEVEILLPGTGWDEAEVRAEHIRHAIEKIAVTTSGKHGEPVILDELTASIGITVIPAAANPTLPPSDALEAALRAADQAVYEAKSAGRNRVATADFTISTPPLCGT